MTVMPSPAPASRARIAVPLALALVLGAAPADAQERPPAPPLEGVEWLVGTWEGEASVTHPGGTSEVSMTERVEERLDGRLLVVEGIGSAATDGRVVHHAFAVLSRTEHGDGHRFHTWLVDGRATAATARIEEDGTLVWGFEAPDGSRIRYRIERTDDGRWHETGARSTEGGETWARFFEMTLEKLAD